MTNEYVHTILEEFHFLRPQYLWLLVPIGLMLIIGVWTRNESIKWKKNFAPHLHKYIIKKGNEDILKWMRVISAIMSAIAVLGAAGPVWEKVELPGKVLETPVVVMLDLSQSMMTTDLKPNRLERACFKIEDLLNKNPRTRVALVGYAGTAHTIVPLTYDYQIIKSHLDGISPDIMPVPGTNLPDALTLSKELCAITSAPATFILVSDAFDQETFEALSKTVKSSKTSIEILPFATPTGGNVPRPNSRYDLRDEKGKSILSRLDTQMLLKLASLNRVTVHSLTLDNSDMELLAQKLADNAEILEDGKKKEDDWIEHGHWLAAPFLLMTLLWFRRGYVLYGLAFIISFSSCTQLKNNSFKDLWLTQDFQAQQLMNVKKYEAAAHIFEDNMRQGIAYYKAENYDMAVQAFRKDTTAEGMYNLALAYAQNGEMQQALFSIQAAKEMNPDLQGLEQLQQQIGEMAGTNETDLNEAQEASEQPTVNNKQNDSPEDLSGGGQEATDEDMKKERLEETTNTDIRKGKELEELPDDFEMAPPDPGLKVLMQKADDDPSLFLKRKFAYQQKKSKKGEKETQKTW